VHLMSIQFKVAVCSLIVLNASIWGFIVTEPGLTVYVGYFFGFITLVLLSFFYFDDKTSTSQNYESSGFKLVAMKANHVKILAKIVDNRAVIVEFGKNGLLKRLTSFALEEASYVQTLLEAEQTLVIG
jgi:hypothetical protein